MAPREFPVAFGKVTYEPGSGAPKDAARWIWVCDCAECQKLNWFERSHGPFKTRRQAEQDYETMIFSVLDGDTGPIH